MQESEHKYKWYYSLKCTFKNEKKADREKTLTCKSKCKFVRVNAIAKCKNFDLLLQTWQKPLYKDRKRVKINNIKQEIGKKAKNSQRSDCRLLFCKGKSHP